jgi:hypothetical protein
MESTLFMKITVFWDLKPCSLIGRYQLFEWTYCFNLQGVLLYFGARDSTIVDNFRKLGFELYVTILKGDRLCSLVVRVPGYRSRGPGFDSRFYQIFWEVVGLERGPLSLVRITEELLERTVAAPVYKIEIKGRGDSLRWLKPRSFLSRKGYFITVQMFLLQKFSPNTIKLWSLLSVKVQTKLQKRLPIPVTPHFSLRTTLKMEAAGSSETLVPFNQSLRRDIPGESNLYIHRR